MEDSDIEFGLCACARACIITPNSFTSISHLSTNSKSAIYIMLCGHGHYYIRTPAQFKEKQVYASAAAAAAAGAGAVTSGFGSLDTRKLLRATLSSVLQLLHLSFAESLNPSTPSTFPKSTTLSASQLGQGPEATRGFWKNTFSAKNLEPNCEKERRNANDSITN